MPLIVEGDFSPYCIIFLVIFLFAALLPGYRYTGIISFVGLVCFFLSIFVAFFPHEEFMGDQTINARISIRFMKMYGAPQVAVVVSNKRVFFVGK